MEQQQVLIKIVLDNWYGTVARTNKLLGELTDAEIEGEVSADRNSGKYLLGHLAAVHDRMMPLLGFGEQAYAHYNDVFLTSPDRSGKEMPSVAELRASWNDANAKLDAHFKTLSAADWFQRHTSVSEEDFAKEPHRNKLGVVVSRTNHLAGHLGQMVFLKKK
ncbi:hypothetical protein GCM10023093_16310 [Nemorincola caseinilytica]|uniref:DinB-like domain-containing protein n=1 Tax=Nemorincola caseinilytica TaxID=2054315 RepID=A0ABP8NFF1_9BACT